ncbi:aromatic acid decarboxylase [Candidatus Bathyarchaeota archaeon]|nr:MAG: aromatic acid decarboxylase [Candidatus Bathyarchaeota archaeon]
MTRRFIVGVSGASGMIYTVRLLQVLRGLKAEVHLILTRAAEKVLGNEGPLTVSQLKALASHCYDPEDLEAPIASGDFSHEGMVVAPCSMKTLAGIASGYSQNLLLRAADVALKEGRKLILVPRETPLNPIHLENMLKLARLGVVILPAMPAFYHKPENLSQLADFIVGKILDQLGVEHRLYRKWRQPSNLKGRKI